jgi:hypothetical protein
MHRRLFIIAVVWIAGPVVRAADPPEVAEALTTLKAVGREGAGNEAAGPAWKRLVAQGGAALLPTLIAFDSASPTAANWLRSAVDAIIEAEQAANRKLPADQLEAFVLDTQRNPAARRIAFEILTAEVPAKKNELLPKMIDDASLDLRRDAIAAEMDKVANESDMSARRKAYERLFRAARDRDQVVKLAELLDKHGAKPDVTAHFGFITRWYITGPFDSPGGQGFDTPFPPEEKVDLSATYTGKDGASISWKPVETTKPEGHYALVNLNTTLEKYKDAVAYAYAVVEVEKETPVELRAACPTAIKMFVNGRPVFAREEYHHGNVLDQHAGPAVLKPGRNEILIKICQNNQKEDWAQVWEFEVRICDATGGAIPYTLVLPTAAQAAPPKLQPIRPSTGDK